jgi:hypothetical protein
MAEHPRITLDRDVMVGKPVIVGTRITVELILGLLAEGWTEQEILAACPHLRREDSNRGKSNGSQAVAQRCRTTAGKYGTSGRFGTARREPR